MWDMTYKEGDDLPAVEKAVTQERVERYARASGDFNPVHVDREFAASSQFGGTIAHGMMIAASISEMMTMAFEEHWLRGGQLKIRFRAPVFPGETVTAHGRVKTVQDVDGALKVVCSVGVRKDSGESAITGDATLILPGGP